MVEIAKTRLVIGTVMSAILFIILINIPLSLGLNENEKFTSIGMAILIGWLFYLKYAIPRCPKCGYTVISALEIKGFPVFAKIPSGNKCAWCGEAVDET